MSNSTQVKTILILAANPTDTTSPRLDQEVREIQQGLQRASNREQFRVVQKWAVRSPCDQLVFRSCFYSLTFGGDRLPHSSR